MHRSIAASLGALAMALVALRGVLYGQHAGDVAGEAILAMLVFVVIGYVAGRIADYLVRDSLEQMFRARVGWYRQGVEDAKSETTAASEASGRQQAASGQSVKT